MTKKCIDCQPSCSPVFESGSRHYFTYYEMSCRVGPRSAIQTLKKKNSSFTRKRSVLWVAFVKQKLRFELFQFES